MEAIITAVTFPVIASGITALLVAAVGVRVIFAGYKFVKSALGRV